MHQYNPEMEPQYNPEMEPRGSIQVTKVGVRAQVDYENSKPESSLEDSTVNVQHILVHSKKKYIHTQSDHVNAKFNVASRKKGKYIVMRSRPILYLYRTISF